MKKTSASQLSTAELCLRMWWFKHVAKIPEPKKGHHAFGSLMHAAIERYLKSQELWPQGWDYDHESKLRLTPAEAALVQVLVQEGIKAGHIERRVGGMVESEFTLPAIPGVIEIAGKIDYRDMARVEDHKHSKSVRYFKSKEALKKDLQMMIYAKRVITDWREKGLLPPPIITLTHNQFLKDFDNPEVRQRSAEVTPREIDDFWEKTVLELVRKQESARDVTDPFSIPDPPKDACNAFGGCPRRSVCSGAETVEAHRRRMKPTSPKPQTMTTPVSPNDFLNRRTAPAGSPTVNPPAPSASVSTATTNVSFPPPPWHWTNCPMCSKKPTPGWNDKKAPCRICIATTKIATDQFEWIAQGDGKISWWRKGEKLAESPATPAVAQTGAKTSHTAPDFVGQMKAAKDTETVSKLLAEAVEALGNGTPEAQIVMEVAEKRLDELIDAATTKMSAKRHLELKGYFAGSETPGACDLVIDTAASEGASPEQMAELNDAATARKSWLKAQAAAVKPAPVAVPEEPKEEPPPPPKRGPGRPRKEQPAADTATEPKVTVEHVTTAPAGLVLIIGADVTTWPGAHVVLAETVLNQIPGYWDTIEGGVYNGNAAFRRRDAVRQAANSMVEKLKGLVIVQKFRDPDVSNLMSSLMPHATTVITGVLL